MGPYKNARVILNIPHEQDIRRFNRFGLWSTVKRKDIGHVIVPGDFKIPEMQFLQQEFRSNSEDFHKVQSGPVLVMDRRTVKIYGFQFDGTRAAKFSEQSLFFTSVRKKLPIILSFFSNKLSVFFRGGGGEGRRWR